MIVVSNKVVLKDGRTLIMKSPQPEDASLLLQHLSAVFHESYRNMNQPPDHFDNFPVEKEALILRDFADSKEKFMISAWFNDRIVGNLGCFGASSEFLKHSARIGMGIEQAFCGNGLGSAMLDYAIEVARSSKLRRLELTVRTFNHAGIRLYEKSGFERVGLLKGVAFIDGEYHDEYFYQRQLSHDDR